MVFIGHEVRVAGKMAKWSTSPKTRPVKASTCRPIVSDSSCSSRAGNLHHIATGGISPLKVNIHCALKLDIYQVIKELVTKSLVQDAEANRYRVFLGRTQTIVQETEATTITSLRSRARDNQLSDGLINH